MPKISIIIPVYNTENYIEKCLESIINQSFSDIEIICINDGCTDGTSAILKKYAQKDSRILLLEQENAGAAAARNNGLKHVSSPYIMFCDSDDSYEPEMCESMYNCITNNPDFDMVICDCNVDIMDNVNRVTDAEHIKRHYNNLFGNIKLDSQNKADVKVFLWNKFFKKSIIDKYNLTFPNLFSGEDNAFIYLYISCINNAYGLNKKLYNYSIHRNSITEKSTGTNHSTNIFYVFYFVFEKLHLINKLEENIDWLLNLLQLQFYWRLKALPKITQYEIYPLITKTLGFVNPQLFKDKNYKLLNLLRCEKYDKFYRLINGELTFMQKVFSLKNSEDKKVLRIFGLKISFRRETK